MSQPPILEQNSFKQTDPEQLQTRSSDTPCAEPCQAAAPPKTFTQRLWQIFKLCTRIIVYVPLSLLVLMALLLGTEIGSRISVELADKFVPDLALTYTSGTLNKELTLAHASWSMAGIQVELEDLHLAWRPTCLLQKQLCVNALNASKVDISIETDALNADNNTNNIEVISDDTDEPTELVLPFGITL
ncbi:MAG: translocation/assembly module TamB domain-containing protein, partial [Shewanella sp.]